MRSGTTKKEKENGNEGRKGARKRNVRKGSERGNEKDARQRRRGRKMIRLGNGIVSGQIKRVVSLRKERILNLGHQTTPRTHQ